MKRRQRIASVSVILMFSSLVLAIHPSHFSSGALSEEDMKTYMQTFLANYNKELEENFRPQFRKYFPFYWDYQYYINATISNVHGAALEFTPWDHEVFESNTIDTRVEPTVFEYVDLNITSVANSTGYTVVIYTGEPSIHGLPFITIKAYSHVFFSDTIFVTNKASFVEAAEGGELFLSNVIVDGRLFHTLIMRGSNELSAWTAEQAENDAHRFFESDLYWAFNRSEEVREYIAYPELRQLLEEIVWKRLHAEKIGYDLFDFKEDLAKVRDLARDKYYVSTEFVDELLDYLMKIAMTPSPPPPWEVAPWSWIFAGLVGVALTAIAAKVYKRLKPARKKLKKKKRSRRKKM